MYDNVLHFVVGQEMPPVYSDPLTCLMKAELPLGLFYSTIITICLEELKSWLMNR